MADKNYLTMGLSGEAEHRMGAGNRQDNRAYLAEQLETLLRASSENKDALIAGLKRLGMADAEGNTGVENEEAVAIVGKIQDTIAEFRGSNPVTPRIREATRESVATSLRGQEAKEIDPRLKSLVVDPINALPEEKKQGRTGEEVARAIPDVAAFLAETDQMKEGTFFELNERGQLVMKDGVKEAYGLGENALQARIRQTRIVYRSAEGQTKVMTGEQYFSVTKSDEKGTPLEMEVSEEAKKIDGRSIIMARGLPTLQWKEADEKHIGEYARMNDKGQFERQTYAWVEDDTITDASRARVASWVDDFGRVDSAVFNSRYQLDVLGSRGVLRVNLNFES